MCNPAEVTQVHFNESAEIAMSISFVEIFTDVFVAKQRVSAKISPILIDVLGLAHHEGDGAGEADAVFQGIVSKADLDLIIKGSKSLRSCEPQFSLVTEEFVSQYQKYGLDLVISSLTRDERQGLKARVDFPFDAYMEDPSLVVVKSVKGSDLLIRPNGSIIPPAVHFRHLSFSYPIYAESYDIDILEQKLTKHSEIQYVQEIENNISSLKASATFEIATYAYFDGHSEYEVPDPVDYMHMLVRLSEGPSDKVSKVMEAAHKYGATTSSDLMRFMKDLDYFGIETSQPLPAIIS